MTSLFREVFLPSAAAVGLLFAAAVDVATAGEAPIVEPVQVAAAAHKPAPTEPTADADPSSSGNKSFEVERRCERIERIGKFTIKRCK